MIVKVKHISHPKGGQNAIKYSKSKEVAGMTTDNFKIQGRTYHFVISASEQETEKISAEQMVEISQRTLEELQEKTNNYFEYNISVHNDNGYLHAHVQTSGLTNLSKQDLKEFKANAQSITQELSKKKVFLLGRR
ncbi:MAG: hypothetical protein JW740_02800 [Candidatus Zambryskibacteria bacterium]|nr:hypothetical protein [Candidatus Zambryskibacteria bacterium]